MHIALSARLEETHPSLAVSGYWAPERSDVESHQRSRQVAQSIRDAGTDILFVGLGKPRQELWIEDHGSVTGASVLLAFGAAADFYAGVQDRAPEWMSRSGLEWSYRLYREPTRLWKRYLVQGPLAAYRMRTARLQTPLSSAA
jgi:exopolysaccharide biosynthesis WecB/TagA/CpsF family protein